MAKRDEFDDEGFFDSLLNRKGNTELPPGLRRIFIVIGVLVLIGILVAVISAIPSGKDGNDDMAPVPIIRADTAPYKIKPEDPGGMKVPNKDSTIFETLKGQPEENKVENLLEDESDTAESVASVAREEVASKVIAKSEPITDINDLELDTKPEQEELSAPPQPQPVAKLETVKAEPIKEEPKESGSIIDTLKADSKPKELPLPKVVSKTEPKIETPKVTAPKPAPVSSGGSTYIQLAAVKSEAEASSQWSKFKSKNPELAALSMRTQRADLGAKGVFFRIQAGPLTPANATAVCSAVKSRGGNCIIAK